MRCTWSQTPVILYRIVTVIFTSLSIVQWMCDVMLSCVPRECTWKLTVHMCNNLISVFSVYTRLFTLYTSQRSSQHDVRRTYHGHVTFGVPCRNLRHVEHVLPQSAFSTNDGKPTGIIYFNGGEGEREGKRTGSTGIRERREGEADKEMAIKRMSCVCRWYFCCFQMVQVFW